MTGPVVWGIATIHVETPPWDPEAQTSTVHYSPTPVDEIRATLDAEAQMYRATGWMVAQDGGPVVVVSKVRHGDMKLVTRVVYACNWPADEDGQDGLEPRPVLRDEDLAAAEEGSR